MFVKIFADLLEVFAPGLDKGTLGRSSVKSQRLRCANGQGQVWTMQKLVHGAKLYMHKKNVSNISKSCFTTYQCNITKTYKDHVENESRV